MFELDPFPLLETERLLLREIVPEDVSSVFRFRSDPVGQRYNGGPLTRIEEAADLIASMAARYRDRTMVEWGVTLKGGDDSVIGLFGYANWDRTHRRAEIGYDLANAYWRQGLGTEAMRAIVPFGFQSMDLNRIHACPWTENVASVRLLEKVRFRREGVLREEYWVDGAFHDEAMYGLLRNEYRSMPED